MRGEELGEATFDPPPKASSDTERLVKEGTGLSANHGS
jgi:hypothetical protein